MADRAATGRPETSWCQMLSAGKIAQDADAAGGAEAVELLDALGCGLELVGAADGVVGAADAVADGVLDAGAAAGCS